MINSMAGPPDRPSTGFSLIELVIAMAILSIVTALSVNGYRQHVYRTNRSDAAAALLRIAAAQERYFLNHDAYAVSLEQLGFANRSDRGLYSLSLETNDSAMRFRAHARPAHDARQRGDLRCSRLTIDETGRRSAAGEEPGGPPDARRRCWG
jgi:type IV pilus assembly protein PilE